MLDSEMSPDTLQAPGLLRRDECALALTRAGFRTSPKTLASKATRGGGPPYRKFGRTVLYRWSEVLAWAESRLTTPVASTSQMDALRSDQG